MTVKAIIFDLDRTLLRTDKTVSKRTENAVAECAARGIKIFAATARPTRNVNKYSKILGLDAFTALNGAAIVLPDAIIEHPIPRQSAEAVISRLIDVPDTVISVETSDGLFANGSIPMWNPKLYDGFPRLPTDGAVYKVLFRNCDTKLLPFVTSVLTPDTYCTVANRYIVQVMSREATKMKGIARMLSHFGIDPSDAVCFGDDHDDIEPICSCGIGVAVANAIPELLRVADAVTSSNDEDGVAEYIENFII